MADQADHLRQKLRTLQAEPPKSAGNRVIAVASGKGGVGKSNFCVNFALGLQKAGHRPIVIDADIGFANIEVLMGVRPTHTIVDVLSGLNIWQVLQTGPGGLSYLSAGNGLLDIHSLTSMEMDRILMELRKLHERYDTVIIDSGAGMGTNVSRLVGAADSLVLVTTPEPTALTDAYALLKLLHARDTLPTTQVVVNRSRNLVDGRLAADKLRLVADRFLGLSVGVLGYILDDEAVVNAVMKQQLLLMAYPNSPAARCYQQLVHNYLKIDGHSNHRGIAGFIDRLLRAVRIGNEVDSGHPA